MLIPISTCTVSAQQAKFCSDEINGKLIFRSLSPNTVANLGWSLTGDKSTLKFLCITLNKANKQR